MNSPCWYEVPKLGITWVQGILSPGRTLTQRVVRGGLWVFGFQVVARLLSLLRTVVLARVLAPSDFGLFGIALLVLSVLETSTETGFQAALIQKEVSIKRYLDTAWTVQVLRGALLSLVVFGIAPYVALFFAEPVATRLLRVLALSVLFRGFTNIGVVYFAKELEFNKHFVFQLLGTLADLSVTTLAALVLRNVWALILGRFAGSLTRLLVSYVLHPYRPRLQWDVGKARELYSFGRWMFASAVLVFLLTQGDDVFVGKLLGAAALGLYQMAYTISNLPSTELTSVLNRVTFPAFSKVQSNPTRLRRLFLRSFSIAAAVAIPIAGEIFVLAEELTWVLLGPQWMPMVPTMQVLAVWGCIRALGGSTSPLLQALGRPHLITLFHLIMVVLLIISIYPLTMQWGILGTGLAVAVGNFIVHWFRYPIIAREIQSPSWAIYRLVLLPFIATVAMVGATFVLKSSLGIFVSPSLWGLIVLSGFGIAIYILVMYLFRRFLHYDLFSLVRQMWRRAVDVESVESATEDSDG